MNVSLTERDERLLAWLSDVRLADIESVRVALGALAAPPAAVSLRRAQQRVAKLEGAGLLRRARPRLRSGSVLWVAPAVSGRREPNVFAATAAHDVGVAAVSADMIAQGYRFELDERVDALGQQLRGAHVGDGIATAPDGQRYLIEVELSPKTNAGRYQRIMRSHTQRIGEGKFAAVWYFCSATAKVAVERAVSSYLSPALQSHVQLMKTFNAEHEYVATTKARRARGVTPRSPAEGDAA